MICSSSCAFCTVMHAAPPAAAAGAAQADADIRRSKRGVSSSTQRPPWTLDCETFRTEKLPQILYFNLSFITFQNEKSDSSYNI